MLPTTLGRSELRIQTSWLLSLMNYRVLSHPRFPSVLGHPFSPKLAHLLLSCNFPKLAQLLLRSCKQNAAYQHQFEPYGSCVALGISLFITYAQNGSNLLDEVVL